MIGTGRKLRFNNIVLNVLFIIIVICLYNSSGTIYVYWGSYKMSVADFTSWPTCFYEVIKHVVTAGYNNATSGDKQYTASRLLHTDHNWAKNMGMSRLWEWSSSRLLVNKPRFQPSSAWSFLHLFKLLRERQLPKIRDGGKQRPWKKAAIIYVKI